MWRDLRVFSANDIARMDEVQFISDLALNFINGLSDYSAARLDKAYADNDDEFPKQAEVGTRLERVFSKIAALKPESIRDTVFSRLPLFFSLCILLDSAKKTIAVSRVESTLFAIDHIVRSDIPLSDRKKKEAEFITACTASTQRIRQRTVRNEFIGTLLGM